MKASNRSSAPAPVAAVVPAALVFVVVVLELSAWEQLATASASKGK
ncbi:hypothetical protein ACFQT0_15630 [Hymenobacter humi]|uniref:Uncharacterized protein n=1 Tax=Hymenobacter humi TaxID=1411620 RepID=A0ABW2U584_9BACT